MNISFIIDATIMFQNVKNLILNTYIHMIQIYFYINLCYINQTTIFLNKIEIFNIMFMLKKKLVVKTIVLIWSEFLNIDKKKTL